jgi:hypothetical protein
MRQGVWREEFGAGNSIVTETIVMNFDSTVPHRIQTTFEIEKSAAERALHPDSAAPVEKCI